jgi:hypothetical protein
MANWRKLRRGRSGHKKTAVLREGEHRRGVHEYFGGGPKYPYLRGDIREEVDAAALHRGLKGGRAV